MVDYKAFMEQPLEVLDLAAPASFIRRSYDFLRAIGKASLADETDIVVTGGDAVAVEDKKSVGRVVLVTVNGSRHLFLIAEVPSVVRGMRASLADSGLDGGDILHLIITEIAIGMEDAVKLLTLH